MNETKQPPVRALLISVGGADKAALEEKLKNLGHCGFSHKFAANSNSEAMTVFRQIEGQLKGDKLRSTGLRLYHKAANRTPLGYSRGPGERQGSAVYFRPCAMRTNAGNMQYSLLTFQAPDTVLGDSVKNDYAVRTRLI